MNNENVEPQPPTPEAEPDTEAVDATATEGTETATPKTWKENFSVKTAKVVETVDRLNIVVGVNEFKGSNLVYLAKVTDKEFSKQFFAMPAYVWEKVLKEITAILPDMAKIEKASMLAKVQEEIKRLRALGVDVSGLAVK